MERIVGGQAAQSWPAWELKIPRANELQPRCLEIRQIASRQAPAVDLSNRRDHSIRRSHDMPLPYGSTHDVAVGKRCFFSQPEYPIRKATPPMGEPILEPHSALIRSDFLNAEGYLGDSYGR